MLRGVNVFHKHSELNSIFINKNSDQHSSKVPVQCPSWADDGDDDYDDMNIWHLISLLRKMISEICYFFPLVRYKHCQFADMPVQMDMYPGDDSRGFGFCVFSTCDVAEQRIHVPPSLNI